MVPWRTVFFAVNFSGSLLFIGVCALAIGLPFGGGGDPYSFVMGLILIWPAIAFGVAEWCLYVRRVKRLERPLGVLCGQFAGVTVLLVALSVANAVKNGSSTSLGSWFGVGLLALAIAGYGRWCCWLRMNGRTLIESEGERG